MQYDDIFASDGTRISRVERESTPVVRTPSEIIESLTEAEYGAVWLAGQQSPLMARWLDMLRTNQTIRADDPRTIAGCQAAVALGLLSVGRVLEIFGVAL